MTDVEIIIKTLEDQRNIALTQTVQLKVDNFKLQELLKEKDSQIAELLAKLEKTDGNV